MKNGNARTRNIIDRYTSAIIKPPITLKDIVITIKKSLSITEVNRKKNSIIWRQCVITNPKDVIIELTYISKGGISQTSTNDKY